MDIDEFCKELPKIELHAHLNGSLSADTLKQLGCLDTAISEYQKMTKLIEKNNRTLNECFQVFQVAQTATNNPSSLYLATKSVIEDFCNDNVRYLELRTTPRAENGMTKEDYVESVVKAIQHCDKQIMVKLLLSIDRARDASEGCQELIVSMAKKHPEIIKGVDFSGNPRIGRFDRNLFESFRQNGLKITLHCGEIKNDEEVAAMLDFQPDRLGHGTFIHPHYGGCNTNWEMYKKLQIPLECCLTSNVTCGTAKSYKQHHLAQWIGNSLPFSLNTDDKGVFSTNLSNEYGMASKHFNFTPNDLLQISYKSIDHTFASASEKDQLKSILDEFSNKHLFNCV